MQHGSGYGHYPQGPYMGPPPKKPMSTGLVLLVVFGGLLGTCTMCGVIRGATKQSDAGKSTTAAAAEPSVNAPRTERAPVAAPRADPPAPPLAVTSMQLWSDYQANEIAADSRYKGKTLLVSGSVSSIDKGPFGGLLLRLATGNQFMSTTCHMDESEEARLAELSRGQQVRVLCTCQGIVLKSPQLADCSLR